MSDTDVFGVQERSKIAWHTCDECSVPASEKGVPYTSANGTPRAIHHCARDGNAGHAATAVCPVLPRASAKHAKLLIRHIWAKYDTAKGHTHSPFRAADEHGKAGKKAAAPTHDSQQQHIHHHHNKNSSNRPQSRPLSCPADPAQPSPAP